MSNKKLLIYCGLIFFVSWVIQIFIILIFKDLNSLNAKLGLSVTMISPLLVTIGFMISNKNLRTKLLWKPKRNVFCISLLAIVISTITAFIVLFVMQYLSLGHSGWFEFSSSSVAISGGPFLLGLGQQTWIFFIFNILITAIVYSLLTGIIAIGEEFAWRGFLQGILIERYGIIKGIIFLGFLWAMWHLPIQLAGYNYSDNPVLGSLIISPLMLISVSFFYAWLTLKSNSFLPAAIAHGAFNTIEEGVILNINLEVPMLYLISIKLVVTLLTGLVFIYLIRQKSFNIH